MRAIGDDQHQIHLARSTTVRPGSNGPISGDNCHRRRQAAPLKRLTQRWTSLRPTVLRRRGGIDRGHWEVCRGCSCHISLRSIPRSMCRRNGHACPLVFEEAHQHAQQVEQQLAGAQIGVPHAVAGTLSCSVSVSTLKIWRLRRHPLQVDGAASSTAVERGSCIRPATVSSHRRSPGSTSPANRRRPAAHRHVDAVPVMQQAWSRAAMDFLVCGHAASCRWFGLAARGIASAPNSPWPAAAERWW